MLNKKITVKLSSAILVIFLILLISTGCGEKRTDQAETSLLEKSFDEIVKMAEGTEVNFYMWGGDQRVNAWVDNFVAERVKKEYGIKLNRIPMNAEDFINKLLGEKQLNKKEGSIDLLWINGENFWTAKENGLLFGPFIDKIPNYTRYLDTTSDDNLFDFGYPTEGFEAPYGRAQLVFIYDESKIPVPPKDLEKLKELVMKNPGKFTYPAPPDFTGSAFIRNVIYETAGGYKRFIDGDMNEDELKEAIKPAWDYLNEIKPYLWKEGKTYPAALAQQENMFADGEVWITMSYTPFKAAGEIKKGTFPETAKTFILEKGTIGNTHFLAIPFNARNKAGAMVVINFLQGFEAQASKFDPENWGDLPVFDYDKLSAEERQIVENTETGEATLSLEELLKHRVPEMPSKFVPIIEEEWMKNVVQEGN